MILPEALKAPQPDIPEGEQTAERIPETPAEERELPIGEKELARATEILKKYKAGKTNLESRVVENERWWKMRHWELIDSGTDKQRPQPKSAWLFNSIINKHADAMDNYPEPAILPREESDKQLAQTLSSVLPVVLERNEFEQTYSDAWWYKLRAGTAVYGVFWNNRLEQGIGDIDIKSCDILNLFWEPGISDIQQSRNFFSVALVDNEVLEQQYPQCKGKLGAATLDVAKYVYDDQVDTSEKSVVVDWYYKKFDGVRETLHYVKYVDGILLFASENDPEMSQRGFYDHVKYPFVFDTLFVAAGSPCGFGYIDIMKDAQMYIDKLGQVSLEHAVKMTRKRWLIPQGADINEKEFLDWTKPAVHFTGTNPDNVKELKIEPLDSSVTNLMQLKIDELKETSGNRDFSQGSTTAGVTAASAIAALQEAGSKTSRDMLKSSYRAFRGVTSLCVELIRQFYDEPRCFRITGEMGAQQFAVISNAEMQGLGLSERRPMFDINIQAQKRSSFSRISQNELAKEMYNLGFFNPQLADQALMCIGMMDFEGKSEIEQKISQNGTLYQQLQQMTQTAVQLAQIVDGLRNTNLAEQIAAPMTAAASVAGAAPTSGVQTVGTSSQAERARQQAAEGSDPTK